MAGLRSYPKVYQLGHPNIRDLFDGPVVIQEKIDGSQFSFGVIDGELFCRSRSADITRPCKDKLFAGAVDTAVRLFEEGKLIEGWVYRGEVISKPKHNTLQYERVPEGQVILFDIDKGVEDRIRAGVPYGLEDQASDLGLECVPTYMVGEIINPEGLHNYITNAGSVLGGPIEGVVIKNYNRFNKKDGKMLMGKYVSESFKESHRADWKERNPNRADVIEKIVAMYSSPARFEKAVQRRRDRGELLNEPADIGPLMQDLHADTEEECSEVIKQMLWEHFRKDILRGIGKGLPNWYKDRLMEEQFNA